jgi:hypothetical protein
MPSSDQQQQKSLMKRLVSLCFVCLRKHDNSATEDYKQEEEIISDMIDLVDIPLK